MSNGLIKILPLILLLCACKAYDDDSKYLTESQGLLLLSPDSTGNAVHWASPEFLLLNFNQSLGIDNSHISDMKGDEHFLYLNNLANSQILIINLRSRSITGTVQATGLKPHFFAKGKNSWIFADTSAREVRMQDSKSGESHALPVQAGRCEYLSGYYLVVGDSTAALINEQAYAVVSESATGYSPEQILINRNRQFNIIYRGAGKTYLNRFDLNSKAAVSAPMIIPHSNWRFTPYLHNYYTTEILHDIYLLEGELSGLDLNRTFTGFEVDFFGGYVYASSGDSLFVIRDATAFIDTAYYLPDSISHAFNYLDHQMVE